LPSSPRDGIAAESLTIRQPLKLEGASQYSSRFEPASNSSGATFPDDL
jgi:hypothetical protein